MDEQLVPIFGYEGLYSITRSGKIFSHTCDTFLRLTPKYKTYGHSLVCLYKNGHGITYAVDTLVSRMFE